MNQEISPEELQRIREKVNKRRDYCKNVFCFDDGEFVSGHPLVKDAYKCLEFALVVEDPQKILLLMMREQHNIHKLAATLLAYKFLPDTPPDFWPDENPYLRDAMKYIEETSKVKRITAFSLPFDSTSTRINRPIFESTGEQENWSNGKVSLDSGWSENAGQHNKPQKSRYTLAEKDLPQGRLASNIDEGKLPGEGIVGHEVLVVPPGSGKKR